MNIACSRFGVLGLALGSTAFAQVTQRVSVTGGGAQANHQSGNDGLDLSPDGRFVLFGSFASNLVAGDTNGTSDVFVRDRVLGTTERVSVGPGGVEANGSSRPRAITPDGRFVAFTSAADNLVPGDTNAVRDLFVRDRQLGTTERISVASDGTAANDFTEGGDLSSDGRYVIFSTQASNLVAGDTNGVFDGFLRDRALGTTERVTVGPGGVEGDDEGFALRISSDGRFVGIGSLATNLVPGDTNGVEDAFVLDRQTGNLDRVSLDSGGLQGDDISDVSWLSDDGRYVGLLSYATNLVAGDTNGKSDAFLRDRLLGTTEVVSVDSNENPGNSHSGNVRLSADLRYAAFWSWASNLVPGDTNTSSDIFVRDRVLGTTERVSIGASGAQANSYSIFPEISSDGSLVAFFSNASNLVPFDSNAWGDSFVRDRIGGTHFTSICDPGTGGVLACPCSNPPAGPGRGCNNSAGTGGASLHAQGGSYLSSDTLVFTTSDERLTATSVLLQGTTLNAGGAVYGQGVRCLGGTLKRLYTKAASGGSITAPNTSAGDLPVSVRSSALGNAIVAGQSRWYLVFYRDPFVLGGCPTGSTFNATQTGQVSWSP